jgi:hypothetical protein
MGLGGADILEAAFDVSLDTAVQWRLHSTDEAGAFEPKVSLRLLCLPTSLVASTYQTIDLPATPADIANAMWSIETQWPSRGKLVVEVNSRRKWGRSLFGRDLAPNGPPVDVTSCVRPGRNVVRFMQLGDLSQCMFVLHASEAARDSPEALLHDYLALMASDSGRKPGLLNFASSVMVS